MVQALLITLREGLEMALIVVIVLAYLKSLRQERLVRNVWAGTGAALAISVVAGAAIFLAAGEFEGRAEAAFEGTIMLTAVGVLTWMIIWMKRQAQHIRGELHARIDTAVVAGSALGLALVPFVAVLREGIETALFMYAASNTAQPWETAAGGALGLAGAVGLGYLLYRGGRRINLRLFFSLTGTVLIFFAAGLLALGIHELQEAAVLPATIEHVWNMNGVLADGEGVGEWLKGFLGYNGNPSLLEVIAYPAYLGIAFWYFLRPAPATQAAAVQARASETSS